MTVEQVGAKGVVTRDALGRVGETAILIYSAAAGRFRMETKIAAVTASSTQFDPPRRLSLIARRKRLAEAPERAPRCHRHRRVAFRA